jgi:hypothetical protein
LLDEAWNDEEFIALANDGDRHLLPCDLELA